jgi:hypothetical protein
MVQVFWCVRLYRLVSLPDVSKDRIVLVFKD